MRDHVQPKPPHDKDVSRIRHNGDVNSVFISDVHLGFSGCSAEYLCDFLDKVRCKNLYLVGDIIDFWALRRSNVVPPGVGQQVEDWAARHELDRRHIDQLRSGSALGRVLAAALVMLYDPAKKLSRIHLNIQQCSAAAERIFEIETRGPRNHDRASSCSRMRAPIVAMLPAPKVMTRSPGST